MGKTALGLSFVYVNNTNNVLSKLFCACAFAFSNIIHVGDSLIILLTNL